MKALYETRRCLFPCALAAGRLLLPRLPALIAALVVAGGNLEGAPRAAAKLVTPFLTLTIDSDTGRFRIEERESGLVWQSNPQQARFGEVVVREDGKDRAVNLTECVVEVAGQVLTATFRPLPERPRAWLYVRMGAIEGGRSMEIRYEASAELDVRSIRLLDEACWVTDAEAGYVVVPVRAGLLVPAVVGQSFTHRFDTYAYEGCHLAMLGIVKQGSALLLTWPNPYTAAELRSVAQTELGVTRQRLAPSLVLSRDSRLVRLHFLGRGGYREIARAYRDQAQVEGWVSTWDGKLSNHPERAGLFGAINYKLWSVLDRRMSEDSKTEVSSRVNWTFEEAAQVAEHLKRDLKLDRVLFSMGGWIRRGYDNQHPDVLPAAPECGGNEGLAACSSRVRSLGYLFCLHDNYQDMYRDAPSWDEHFLQKLPDGKPAVGGHWAGGRAYLTCSPMALELARRPQNLPAVREVTSANAYFIDTTYAAGLQECFDPQHRLSRLDDMRWKQELSDYARRLFGVFGSECGREWAIPHSDFFEGLTGVSGRGFHDQNLQSKLGARLIPFFEMVYRDTIALHGKYGYDIHRSAEYVLQHLIYGRTLNYHQIPPHLYWKQPAPQAGAAAAKPTSDGTVQADLELYTRGDGGWSEGLHPMDRFVKNTYEMLSPLNELTSVGRLDDHQFLTPDHKVQRAVFRVGTTNTEVLVNLGSSDYVHRASEFGPVTLPPFGFLVSSPTFVAFCALRWGDTQFRQPTLFTLRSQDGKPLNRSSKIRVFHGFGDAGLRLGKREFTIPREALIEEAGT
jgi:hypothetical protein